DFIVADIKKLYDRFQKLKYNLSRHNSLWKNSQDAHRVQANVERLYQTYKMAMQKLAFKDVYHSIVTLIDFIDSSWETIPLFNEIIYLQSMLEPIMLNVDELIEAKSYCT
ncbi:MAG: hypothetical protein K0U12_04225, partial [Gammaproteobacteria bacterium]|nr:hypothetical protein [Gammaproteobacteria bacterium]